MLNKISVSNRILFPISILVFAGIVVLTAFTGFSAYMRENALTEEIVKARVNEYANLLQSQGQGAYTFATSAAPLVGRMRNTPDGRENVIAAFQEIVEENQSILSIWSVWEPNAFDGRDREYANKAYHDETGRFIPAVYRYNQQVVTEHAVDFEDEIRGRYYLMAKATGNVQYIGPYEYQTQNGMLMLYTVAVPIIENGRFLGAVGVDLDVTLWQQTFSRFDLIESGFLGLTSPDGIIVSNKNEQLHMVHYLDATPGFEFNGGVDYILENGGSASYTGVSHVLNTKSYMFVQGTKMPGGDGYWSVFAIIPQKEMHSASIAMLSIALLMGFALLLATIAGIALLVRGQLKDLPYLSEIALQLSEGDLEDVHLNVSDAPTKNEVEKLKQAFHKMVTVTRDRVDILLQIANGDLTSEIKISSPRDKMGVALQKLLANNNQLLLEIQMCADNVSNGSAQISNGAQLLAGSTEEQTSSIELLSASVHAVAKTAKDNQGLTIGNSEMNQQVKKIAVKGIDKMKQLGVAVQDIKQAAKDITGVISVIDNIAFQTNILALNAAMEAARAGENGKAFFVVADEVRNLAAKSAEAASSSNELIMITTAKADLGAEIAQETAAILDEIMENINEHGALIEQIPELLQSQASSLESIYASIDQIIQASQTMGAMSEESASTSEELFTQSQQLYEMVLKYRLNEVNLPGPN